MLRLQGYPIKPDIISYIYRIVNIVRINLNGVQLDQHKLKPFTCIETQNSKTIFWQQKAKKRFLKFGLIFKPRFNYAYCSRLGYLPVRTIFKAINSCISNNKNPPHEMLWPTLADGHCISTTCYLMLVCKFAKDTGAEQRHLSILIVLTIVHF